MGMEVSGKFLGTHLVRRERQSYEDGAQEEPRAELGVNREGVFPGEAQAGNFRGVPLQDRAGVNVPLGVA